MKHIVYLDLTFARAGPHGGGGADRAADAPGRPQAGVHAPEGFTGSPPIDSSQSYCSCCSSYCRSCCCCFSLCFCWRSSSVVGIFVSYRTSRAVGGGGGATVLLLVFSLLIQQTAVVAAAAAVAVLVAAVGIILLLVLMMLQNYPIADSLIALCLVFMSESRQFAVLLIRLKSSIVYLPDDTHSTPRVRPDSPHTAVRMYERMIEVMQSGYER